MSEGELVEKAREQFRQTFHSEPEVYKLAMISAIDLIDVIICAYIYV